jgi:uncharacterized protein (DUF2164 family)
MGIQNRGITTTMPSGYYTQGLEDMEKLYRQDAIAMAHLVIVF